VRPEGICPACGKVSYPNEVAAEIMLRYFRGLGRDITGTYECRRYPGNWHLHSMSLYRAGVNQLTPRQRVLTWLRCFLGAA
jgi:hypothetical protein